MEKLVENGTNSYHWLYKTDYFMCSVASSSWDAVDDEQLTKHYKPTIAVVDDDYIARYLFITSNAKN